MDLIYLKQILNLSHTQFSLNGPSACAAISLALVSFDLGRPVSDSMFITGEVGNNVDFSLVGGIRLQLLAGATFGKSVFFVPVQNKEEVKALKTEVEIIPYVNMDEVFKWVFQF